MIFNSQELKTRNIYLQIVEMSMFHEKEGRKWKKKERKVIYSNKIMAR